MKRIFVVMMAALVLAGSIAPAITSASSYNLSQMRMRKKAVDQQKAEKAFWKQFDKKMSKIQAVTNQKGNDIQQSQ